MPRLIALILSLCVAASASGKTIDEDVQFYLNVLGEPNPRLQASEFEMLSAMGLSDPRLFDAVEKRLLADVEPVRTIHLEKNRVAWYFRALGFSGQSKYEATLSRYTEDRTYRNYAIAAQRELPQYARWNPIISDRSSFDPKLSDDANRLMNMLRADDPLLHRVAAKRAFLTQQSAPVVADRLAELLRASYPKAQDAESEENAGWLINALSRVALDRYTPLLQEIAKQAPSQKLRLRAQSVLDRAR